MEDNEQLDYKEEEIKKPKKLIKSTSVNIFQKLAAKDILAQKNAKRIDYNDKDQVQKFLKKQSEDNFLPYLQERSNLGKLIDQNDKISQTESQDPYQLDISKQIGQRKNRRFLSSPNSYKDLNISSHTNVSESKLDYLLLKFNIPRKNRDKNSQDNSTISSQQMKKFTLNDIKNDKMNPNCQIIKQNEESRLNSQSFQSLVQSPQNIKANFQSFKQNKRLSDENLIFPHLNNSQNQNPSFLQQQESNLYIKTQEDENNLHQLKEEKNQIYKINQYPPIGIFQIQFDTISERLSYKFDQKLSIGYYNPDLSLNYISKYTPHAHLIGKHAEKIQQKIKENKLRQKQDQQNHANKIITTQDLKMKYKEKQAANPLDSLRLGVIAQTKFYTNQSMQQYKKLQDLSEKPLIFSSQEVINVKDSILNARKLAKKIKNNVAMHVEQQIKDYNQLNYESLEEMQRIKENFFK